MNDEKIKMYKDVKKNICEQCKGTFRVLTFLIAQKEVSLCIECRRDIVHLVIDEDKNIEKKTKKLNLIF